MPLSRHEVKPNLTLLGKRPAKNENAKIGKSNWWQSQTGTPSYEEAAAFAQGQVNDESMRVKATGEVDGALYGHVLRPATVVIIEGAGEENSGKYYVDNVSHHLTKETYSQKFNFIRNALGDDTSSAENALLNVLAS